MGRAATPFEARVDGRSSASSRDHARGDHEIAFRDGRAVAPRSGPPTVLPVEDGVLALNGGRQTHVALVDPLEGAAAGASEEDGDVLAPMHGRLIALAVEDGQTVEAGAAARGARGDEDGARADRAPRRAA